MKQNFSFIYKLLLLAGDAFALVLAFTLAFILRVSLDPRPVATPVKALTYIALIATLVPICLVIFSILGLYAKRNFEKRPQELTRLFVAAVFGVVLIITFDFFSPDVILPAKLIPIYAVTISFILLWLIRTLLRNLRLYLYRHHFGVIRVILVGNNESTYYLSKYLHNNTASGYEVVGVVANKKYIFEELRNNHFGSIGAAINSTNPHAIIQTDSEGVVKVYNHAIENHLDYQFIPTHEALFTAKHSVELLGAFPIINVHTTPLIGNGRAVKRAIDVVGSVFGLIIFSPLFLIIAMLLKISQPRGKVFFKQKRLSRFNKPVYIYKFRSHNLTYNGLSPEQAFIKMNRPDLLKQYRQNGDQLKNDPRVTRLGRILRRTSLDELPQLINVLRGEISLVGPRAIVEEELKEYEFKSLRLSVKSGLTGLAQISGRKEISTEERRRLDIYYVQNWSIWLDLTILLRTFIALIRQRGAV